MTKPDPQPLDLSQTLYTELRAIAGRMFASERTGHTLQPTAVVNEACMKLMSCGLPDVPREQQLALAGRALKQVLIDHARAHNADKRGGGKQGGGGPLRLEVDAEVMADGVTMIDFDAIRSALERLRALSERQAEVVTLKIFAGMRMDDIAAFLGTSKRVAESEWTVARAWLRRELAKGATQT